MCRSSGHAEDGREGSLRVCLPFHSSCYVLPLLFFAYSLLRLLLLLLLGSAAAGGRRGEGGSAAYTRPLSLSELRLCFGRKGLFFSLKEEEEEKHKQQEEGVAAGGGQRRGVEDRGGVWPVRRRRFCREETGKNGDGKSGVRQRSTDLLSLSLFVSMLI